MNCENLVLWHSLQAEPVACRVAIAGDFLPAGRLMAPQIRDWDDMAQCLEDYFRDVSLTFANLEACLATDGLTPRRLCGIGEIVSAPESCLDYLMALRSQAVGMANNHSYDFGQAGVFRTREAILSRGMVPIGAGHTLAGPPETFVWQGPGPVRVGFWAAAKATLQPANAKMPGVEPARQTRARQALESLRSQGAQTLIALIHAGCLRTNRPDPEDVHCLDSIAQCGFDVVVACHSHRLSGYRETNGASVRPSFCFYGVGSVVSGYACTPEEREGLIVVAGLNLAGELVRVEVRPVVLDRSGFGTVPAPPAAQMVLDRFRGLSAEIADGSYEYAFYDDMSQGLLQLYIRDAKTAFRQSGIRGLARKLRRIRVRHLRRVVHKAIG